MKFILQFNVNEVNAKITERLKKVQSVIDAQILKDSNYYVPLKTSMLQKSAELHTVIGSGLIVWGTPYAKKQYYGIEFDHSKQDNPNARALWFEAAKASRIKVWEKLANDKYFEFHK